MSFEAEIVHKLCSNSQFDALLLTLTTTEQLFTTVKLSVESQTEQALKLKTKNYVSLEVTIWPVDDKRAHISIAAQQEAS